jgi:hypothetical protein
MSERRDIAMATLESDLRELGSSLDFPTPAPDFASRVGDRIAWRPMKQPWWSGRSQVFGRPVRRAILLAAVLLLLIVAVAAAVGLGLPGLRIIFGLPPDASAVPSAGQATAAPSGSGATSSAALGENLDLGLPIGLDQLDQQAGFHVLRPTDPAVGPPAAAYLDRAKANQVALVWPVRPDLPRTFDPDVGLLLMQFDGGLDTGFFSKAIGQGTTVESVRVNGRAAFWVSGAPHFFFYTGRNGQNVHDERRWVGDALLWSDGTFTYRLETSLGRDVAMRIAESVR